jgi:hypothetical protein
MKRIYKAIFSFFRAVKKRKAVAAGSLNLSAKISYFAVPIIVN